MAPGKSIVFIQTAKINRIIEKVHPQARIEKLTGYVPQI